MLGYWIEECFISWMNWNKAHIISASPSLSYGEFSTYFWPFLMGYKWSIDLEESRPPWELFIREHFQCLCTSLLSKTTQGGKFGTLLCSTSLCCYFYTYVIYYWTDTNKILSGVLWIWYKQEQSYSNFVPLIYATTTNHQSLKGIKSLILMGTTSLNVVDSRARDPHTVT